MAGGLNTYGYVGANPLSYVDRLGLNPAEEEWMLEQRFERDINTNFLGELLAEEFSPYGAAKDMYDFCEDPSLLNAAGFIPFAGGFLKRLPISKIPNQLSRDATGKIHGDLPSAADLKNMKTDDIRENASELRKSIAARKQEQRLLGEHGPHRERIRQEEELLRSLEKKLQDTLGSRNVN